MNQGRDDFYSILGVPKDASFAAIKRAYARLARKLRPDADGAADAIRALQAAYETLTDADRRRSYDEALEERSRTRPQVWTPIGSSAVLDFVGPHGAAADAVLTAAEAARGGQLPLDVPLITPCPACGGSGGHVFECESCEGWGETVRRQPLSVHLPPGLRDGAVFDIRLEEPPSFRILLCIHVRR